MGSVMFSETVSEQLRQGLRRGQCPAPLGHKLEYSAVWLGSAGRKETINYRSSLRMPNSKQS